MHFLLRCDKNVNILPCSAQLVSPPGGASEIECFFAAAQVALALFTQATRISRQRLVAAPIS
jgi:hypothetical protein